MHNSVSFRTVVERDLLGHIAGRISWSRSFASLKSIKRQRSDACGGPVTGGHSDGYPHQRRNLPPQKFGEKIAHHHRKFHSQSLRPLGDERLYQAVIAISEHAGHAVRDNRRREGCAEGCGWCRGLIRTKTIWSVPIRCQFLVSVAEADLALAAAQSGSRSLLCLRRPLPRTTRSCSSLARLKAGLNLTALKATPECRAVFSGIRMLAGGRLTSQIGRKKKS